MQGSSTIHGQQKSTGENPHTTQQHANATTGTRNTDSDAVREIHGKPTEGMKSQSMDRNYAKSAEYVIDKIVAYGFDDNDNVLYRVGWYGYASDPDTWKYPDNLPADVVKRFLRKLKKPVPDGSIAEMMFGYYNKKKQNEQNNF